MGKPAGLHEFEKLVINKFNVYNSLFLNLPFKQVNNTGVLIPLMHQLFKNGLDAGHDPLEILESFFSKHANIGSEEQKIAYMFRVIQYVERQIVLYDSVEDAAFDKMQEIDSSLSIKDFIHLANSTKNKNEIAEKLSSFSARIVFTAHPTQFYPPSVLDIIDKLRLLILKNDIDGIDLVLQQLGLTSLVNSQKPTPFDEAKNIIYFLRNVYYQAVGELYSHIKKQLKEYAFDNHDIIKLGFWPGGDRDGNPFVTSETTMQVADELRMTLMKCYYQDVKKLSHKLTFREVEDVMKNLRDYIYNAIFNAEASIRYEEILIPLHMVRELLIVKYNSLYLDELESLIDKVTIFKTHFAALDIRQNHSVHEQTVTEILKREKLIQNSLADIDESVLIDILLHQNIEINENNFEEAIIKDTIRTFRILQLVQQKNGAEGCNRYIISNSEDIFSVLFVYALFRWCGWQNREITFDIVPLFESMEGMKNSGGIMQKLFDIQEYKRHVCNRQNKQTIMLGFSDGTKDGGYLKANWSIFQTKEILSEVCQANDIKAIFFDGRGGPPARGGGKTHRFYAAHGKKIANHEIQLTIQGQTITSTYGTKEHFMFNCEQLLTAGLSNHIFKEENAISNANNQLISQLAQISFAKYTSLKNHPKFVPYLENKSTLRYYGQANIGSRPVKRGHEKKLEFKDLRAISFVGSWSQLKQNVPGFFGIGTAIQVLINEGKLDNLKQLFIEVPFFKALILNSMMSLSKSYFELTGYIAKDEEYREFWNILHDEFNLSIKMVLLISGYSQLMEEEPVTRSSIEIREQIVLPLLIIQQYALQKLEEDSPYKTIYEKIVRRSLYGNINASRNSA
ncbi:MAG: phosphoenolpyruvate carboxylase [Lentimicrobiaceae bacterium]|nr:phosphoenolpyruvate carboxylase [Lentimicrobiaceae bacterium]